MTPRARPTRTDGRAPNLRVRVEPATAERWSDLERLFGPRGACAGCWCMHWRLPAAEFAHGKGKGNRRALRRIVRAGEVPGLLAYAGSDPVGWCAVAPRGRYPRLQRSRTLAPVDDVPVWSVVCFFVARGWRRKGVSSALLEAAAGHARRAGATVLEGYPVEARGGAMPDVFAWTGLAATFRNAGFEEVARRSETRPIFRRALRRGKLAAPLARETDARRAARRETPATRGRAR